MHINLTHNHNQISEFKFRNEIHANYPPFVLKNNYACYLQTLNCMDQNRTESYETRNQITI